MTYLNIKKTAQIFALTTFAMAAVAVADTSTLPAGVYEGPQLELTVTSTGAVLNTGCRKGLINAPITLSEDGSFSTEGSITPLLPMFPPQNAQVVLDGKYSEQDNSISVSVQIGDAGDTQQYDLVLNGPKNLDVACPR